MFMLIRGDPLELPLIQEQDISCQLLMITQENYGSIFRSLRMNHLRILEVRKLSLKIRLEGK